MMEQRIPEYLVSRKNLIWQTVFSFLFAFVFINVYKPFGAGSWEEYNATNPIWYFVYALILGLIGFTVVAISRVVMYNRSRRRSLYIWQYVVWTFIEIFLMSCFFTLVGGIISTEPTTWELIFTIFYKAIRNTALILLIPYVISILFFSWQDKKHRLDTIQQSSKGPEDPSPQRKILSFEDERGELRLSLSHENLLYIESADNYVIIHYLNKGKRSQFLLRNSLRTMEQTFANQGIIRCHRSCIVNFEHVKVMRRVGQGVILEMDVPEVPDIPVSLTYYPKVSKYFVTGSER